MRGLTAVLMLTAHTHVTTEMSGVRKTVTVAVTVGGSGA